MIKKHIKKGFTLIELVVVIAVIAILAAVSVVTYVSITNKAKRSANEQLVAQFNNIIKGDQDIKAPHDALKMLKAKGAMLANIVPEQKDKYEFAYHSTEKRVIILNNDASKILYPEELKKDSLSAADKVAIFRFAHVDDDISTFATAGFSSYLSDNTPDDEVHFSESLTVNKGLDVGDEDITTLTYDNSAASAAQDVILRTNLVSDDEEVINLSVNAYVNGDDCDHIVHYGKSGNVNVIQSGSHSLVTHGFMAIANVFAGRVYPSNGGKIELAIAKTINAIIGKEEGTGAYGTAPIAGSVEIKDGHTGSDKAVLSFPEGINDNSSAEEIAAAIAQMIDDVYEELNPSPVVDHVFTAEDLAELELHPTRKLKIDGEYYDNIDDKFSFQEDGNVISGTHTIVLLNNVTTRGTLAAMGSFNITIDLNGFNLTLEGGFGGFTFGTCYFRIMNSGSERTGGVFSFGVNTIVASYIGPAAVFAADCNFIVDGGIIDATNCGGDIFAGINGTMNLTVNSGRLIADRNHSIFASGIASLTANGGLFDIHNSGASLYAEGYNQAHGTVPAEFVVD